MTQETETPTLQELHVLRRPFNPLHDNYSEFKQDVYRFIASHLFDVDFADVTADQRNKAKLALLTLAWSGGSGPPDLSMILTPSRLQPQP